MINYLNSTKKPARVRKWLGAVLLLLAVATVSGCQALGFYTQAIKGQYQIWTHQQPIEKLLIDPNTPTGLKERLRLVQELRAFGTEQLKLPVNGHYRNYVDVHRPYVVWNVQAAPEFSLQPKTWWYPLVGSLEYRGYFSKAGATNYARLLKKKGLDVSVGGVEAYSTLGWFKDPVLNTFVYHPDAELAETIFHELGHQRVFAHGDTDFNEAFATAVGEEGARRWLKSKANSEALQAYQEHLERNSRFVRLVMETRGRLESLYGDERDINGKWKAARKNRDVPRDWLRAEKQVILTDMRTAYVRLKEDWGGDSEYDGWFGHGLNNAQLNLIAAYYDLVPGLQQLLEQNAGDLVKFYEAAERLSKHPKKDRHRILRQLAESASHRALPALTP